MTMPAAISTTQWRDEAVMPQDYEDVATLIKVARKARGQIVDFSWILNRADLLSLRRAVYEWGRGSSGRYRCFDARVLVAINIALGETDSSTFVLHEPRNSEGTDCEASCDRVGDEFRLQSHAPFDILFGYGRAGTSNERMGPVAGETLTRAVGMLGWDIHLLQGERFLPVLNALYGMRLDYNVNVAAPSSEPPIVVPVHFHGPFSAVEDTGPRCLFGNEIAKRSGVYLWTINVSGEERPWYVGQTRVGFGVRMGQHLASYLSGQYKTYDPAALSRGEHRLADGAIMPRWPETLPSFLRDYDRLMPNITGVIRLIRFHLAPLDDDPSLYNRVEGVIGRHFKKSSEFFSPGIKLPAAIPNDRPFRLVLSSEAPIKELPTEVSN